MLLDLKYLINKHNLKIKGVFHVGASHGEEMQSYLDNDINNQIWIEAIPEIYEKLKLNISGHSNIKAINECVSDKEDELVEFKITNNVGQSSSFLDLKIHKDVHPDVHVVETIELRTITISKIIEKYKIDMKMCNFLNMDIQGTELLALKGMKDYLNDIDYAYLEVNTKELYANCALLSEIDSYMLTFGFKRIETKMTDCFWGDALYIKQ